MAPAGPMVQQMMASGPGVLDLGELGGHVGVLGTEGLLGHQGDAVIRRQFLQPRGPVFAEAVRGIEQPQLGDFLLLQVGEQPLHRHGGALGGFEYIGEGAEFPAHDHRVAAHAHKGGDPGFLDDLLDLHPLARGGGPDDGRHLVGVDEFLGDGGGLGRVALGIANDQLQRPAVDAPGLVDLIHRHFRHQLGGRADGRRRPRQGEKGPYLDGLFLVHGLDPARHQHYQGRGHENP